MNIKNKKGETIVETLVAILIVAVCFVMLETSIVSAAKINKKASEENVPFIKRDSDINGSCSISVNGVKVATCKVTEEGYYYYE